MDIGALTLFLYTFREREEILKIFEDVSGQRMMGSYFRVGGIALEPPVDFYERVQALLKMMPEKIEYENLLNGNPIWTPVEGRGLPECRRCCRSGNYGTAVARQRSRLGSAPHMPYSGYEKFQFKVPVSNVGDVWTRYTVRVQEMRESVEICQQALDGMPEGPIKANAPKVVLPDREKMKTQMESLIYHFKIVTEGFGCPPARFTRRLNRPVGRWATSWSATARPSPIACTCATPRLPRCRPWKPCA